MEGGTRSFGLDQPATYRVRVQGVLDEGWTEWFEGLELEVTRAREAATITTLTGTVADQAALHGLLRKLYFLGLPILSVHRLVDRGVETEDFQ